MRYTKQRCTEIVSKSSRFKSTGDMTSYLHGRGCPIVRKPYKTGVDSSHGILAPLLSRLFSRNVTL